ncbi:hypothetical protein [Pleionea sediminis]|uniref:hypothetical protein n=1 Tax=Pleionea sediminis TaxID=2569479 RepID=UPI001185CDB0|nr:hypothetical protein [Pleionea sediminis]
MSQIIKASLLSLIASASLSVFSETIELDYDGNRSFEMVSGQDYVISIALDKPYSSFSEICLDLGIDNDRYGVSDTASVINIRYESESNPLIYLDLINAQWSFESGEPDENGNPTWLASKEFPTTHCINSLSDNLKDGSAEFTFNIDSGRLFIEDLAIRVDGVPESVLIQLKRTSEIMFYPESGGTLNYEARLGNFAESMERKRFKMWGVIIMPDNIPFPVLGERTFDVDYGETKEFLNRELNIPSWFKPGIHTMKWFVTELGSNEIYSSELSFVKAESQSN